jgi:hypothetical protein
MLFWFWFFGQQWRSLLVPGANEANAVIGKAQIAGIRQAHG